MTGHVLVVEDSAVVRAVIRRGLAADGLEISEAEDGEQAIALLRTLAPDVVLCDVEMPGRDGFEVLDHVRAHPVHHELPFLFLTGKGDAEEAAAGLARGATDYLRKPFADVELLARVRAALRTKALQDALRDRNDELERLASTDALTGLFNRRFVDEQGRRLLARRRRHGGGLACLLVDVDHFKTINDEHGHATGDEVLVAVARRLERGLRAEDLLGRWGGEEFLVVAADTDRAGAARLGERLRLEVGQTPCCSGRGDVAVTASIGIGVALADESLEEIVARADAALYRAKELGRDRVEGPATAL